MGSRKCSLVKSKDKAKEGYHNYGNNPKRLGGSKVMKTFIAVMAGAPSMLWIDEFGCKELS